jgi:hypothetical protein
VRADSQETPPAQADIELRQEGNPSANDHRESRNRDSQITQVQAAANFSEGILTLICLAGISFSVLQEVIRGRVRGINIVDRCESLRAERGQNVILMFVCRIGINGMIARRQPTKRKRKRKREQKLGSFWFFFFFRILQKRQQQIL